MRRAAAVDENQRTICNALRAVGATVQHLHQIGSGCPDLLVGYRTQTYLLEVKDGTKPPSRRALTADEKIWHSSWKGMPVAIVESVDDALRAIGVSK